MTDWLKNVLTKSQAPKVSVTDVIRQNIGGMQHKRPIETLHASDVTQADFCPRKWAILQTLGKERRPAFIGTAQQATFDVALATEKLVVEQWLGARAIGNWRCRRCDKQVTMCSKPAPGCIPHGAKCLWEYEQPVFVSYEYGISGSIDCLVDLGSHKWTITEVKILKVEDFEKIAGPQPEHRYRTNLYMKIVADSHSQYKDQINTLEARVLYVSRGYGKKHSVIGEILPFREFKVERDEQDLKQILRKAKQLKIFRETGAMPSGICFTALDPAAKSCEVCKECFSGAHKSQQEKL